MFSVLDHGEGSDGANGGHAAPSFALDLTDAIQRVHGSVERPPGLIELQLLPVLNEAAIGKAGTATPKRVEVIFVSV
jgi:tyrosinase